MTFQPWSEVNISTLRSSIARVKGVTGHDQETTEPARGNGQPAGPPVYRGPFRQPGLGTRIAGYERRGTEDFLVGEYSTRKPARVYPICRVPGEHCLCRVEPDRLRYALAQISLIYQLRPGRYVRRVRHLYGAVRLPALVDRVRGILPTPPPDGAHLPGGV